MTDTPAPSLDSIRLELDKAASVVATAARLSAQGRTVDLSALEGKVAGACRAIADLPREEACTLLPTLDALLTALDALEGDLKTHFAAGLGGATSGGAAAPRAAAAYGRNQPPPPPPAAGAGSDRTDDGG
ncbi:hypothetical protein C882_2193 [Caenispirillum salinarum AK4]|uniref:Uncharacterized protein n=1 Tax=Caenispirillum salinarum AK4 TaxID=1238182 RepID=K9GPT7_9PROT|nr:hypothetical protein [Caenispirillum salinarum]EKV26684.1 hypothetical protein C882_2193 [Caenispirillum salinarum AK4]